MKNHNNSMRSCFCRYAVNARGSNQKRKINHIFYNNNKNNNNILLRPMQKPLTTTIIRRNSSTRSKSSMVKKSNDQSIISNMKACYRNNNGKCGRGLLSTTNFRSHSTTANNNNNNNNNEQNSNNNHNDINSTNKQQQQQQQFGKNDRRSNIDIIWEQKTQDILKNIPVGEITKMTWTEATMGAIGYWVTERKRIDVCWELLDRLYLEAMAIDKNNNLSSTTTPTTTSTAASGRPSPSPLVDTLRINEIVNLWRLNLKETLHDGGVDGDYSDILLPSQVSAKMIQYEKVNLISRDAYTHGMILDAASAIESHVTCTKGKFSEDGLHFAEAYLQQWIDDYYNSSTTTTTTTVAPDEVAIGSILHAWVSSGLPEAPQKAESWLEKAKQFGIVPNLTMYMSVISAWSNQGNPREAANWIERMQIEGQQYSPPLLPDAGVWNALMMAWVKGDSHNQRHKNNEPSSPSSPSSNPATTGRPTSRRTTAERVESILQSMWKQYESGKLSEPPDVISYSIVMDAWAKEASWKNKKAARRVQALLQQMKGLSSSDNNKLRKSRLQPNTVTYNSAITALARSGCHLEAEDLLKEMVTMARNINTNYGSNGGETTDDGDMAVAEPDVQSFAQVIWGWSKVGTFAAAERAESWLKEGMKSYKIRPNVQTYSNCINCWARASSTKSDGPARRAQALFDRMQQHDGLQPDVVTYTALMNAWGRQGNPLRAEEILEEMLHPQNAAAIQPNVRTFSTILSAWSHSRRPEAAERAEMWMRRMTEECGVDPNVVSYSIVLDAWARSRHHQAPDRAMAILEHMNSVPGLRPNEHAYTCAVKAYANHGRAEEAEALLLEMLNNPDLPNPDMYTYSSVLSAWAKAMKNMALKSENSNDSNVTSGRDDLRAKMIEAAARAERLFVRMHQLHDENILDRPPNVVCYGSVLACLARSLDSGAAERAEAILRMMIQNKNHNLEPNLICYNTVMNAWAQQASGKEDDTAILRIEALLGELEQQAEQNPSLRPDRYTYGALTKAIAISDVANKLERVKEVMERMKSMGVEPTHGMMHQIQEWQGEE